MALASLDVDNSKPFVIKSNASALVASFTLIQDGRFIVFVIKVITSGQCNYMFMRVSYL